MCEAGKDELLWWARAQDQSQKSMLLYDSIHMTCPEQGNLWRQDGWVGAWGLGVWTVAANGSWFLFGVMKMFWN